VPPFHPVLFRGAPAAGGQATRRCVPCAGYRNHPAGNNAAFVDGWFRTGNLGYCDNDRYLFLAGRAKEIINRGGEKISPREIDDVLLDHPAVEQALAFALPHDRLGEEVGLDKIPTGPTGKLQRVGLAEKLGLAGAPVPARSSPTAFRSPATGLGSPDSLSAGFAMGARHDSCRWSRTSAPGCETCQSLCARLWRFRGSDCGSCRAGTLCDSTLPLCWRRFSALPQS
jgi:hypothetical protein